MNESTPMTIAAAGPLATSLPGRWLAAGVQAFQRVPQSLIALLARGSIAAVFWSSGQTKVEGFALNLVSGEFLLGWPRLSASALALFQDEYRLPLVPPAIAATLAALAEHVLPLLLLLGLATRLSAFGLLLMTLVIQVFVYPGAYATHGSWAALLLMLMAGGPGRWSIDHLLARRWPSLQAGQIGQMAPHRPHGQRHPR